MKLLIKMLSFSVLTLSTLTAAAQKRMASNDKVKQPTATAPRFMDNVVIENDNEVVNTTATSTRRYTVDQNRVQAISDEETVENNNIAKNNIERGKKTSSGALYSFIDDWYGTPYRYGGTGRNGIDCSAFVRELCQDVYGARLKRTSAEQFEETDYIATPTNLKEGDLVFFKIRSRSISHVGLYLGEGQFVHSSRSKGVVISNLNDSYWSRYYVGGGRIQQ